MSPKNNVTVQKILTAQKKTTVGPEVYRVMQICVTQYFFNNIQSFFWLCGSLLTLNVQKIQLENSSPNSTVNKNATQIYLSFLWLVLSSPCESLDK